MDNETQREGITLSDLWKMVKKRIWIILIVTVVAAIGGFLLMKYVINPAQVFYTMEFAINYPGKEELKYPDGTPFYYQDIVSVEMLTRAKATSSKFASIDVEKLVSSDAITITYTAEDEKKEDVEQYRETYILKVSQKDFPTRELATEFLRAVAGSPVEFVKESAAALDYSLDAETYEKAYSFRERINLLANERSRILNQYNEWINFFRESYKVSDRLLKDYRADVEILFSDEKRDDLLRDISTYDYVPADRLSAKIEELKAEKENNQKKISEIERILNSGEGIDGTSESLQSVAQMYADLKVRNIDIDRKLEALTEENITKFDEKLDAEYASLEAAAQKTREVAIALFDQETRATFDFSRAVEEGQSNVMLIAIGLAVVAFLVASAIVCAVDYPKLRAQKRTEAESEGEKA